MITKRQYIEYLISTPANYTCTNLAEHLQGVSHDAVSDYLAQAKSTAHQLWELVQPLLNDSEQAYLILRQAQDGRLGAGQTLFQPDRVGSPPVQWSSRWVGARDRGGQPGAY